MSQEEKILSVAELQQLIDAINTAREENDIYSNCVQIYTTRQAENTKLISQIEAFLKSQQFSIAGREIVSKKVKGIQISPTANCIRVTLGTF